MTMPGIFYSKSKKSSKTPGYKFFYCNIILGFIYVHPYSYVQDVFKMSSLYVKTILTPFSFTQTHTHTHTTTTTIE